MNRHHGVPEALRALGAEVTVVDEAELIIRLPAGMTPANIFMAGYVADGILDGLAGDPEIKPDGAIRLVYD